MNPSPNVEIFVFLSREVERALADNHTSIGELLRKYEQLSVDETSGSDPVSGENGSRDVATVIIASAALIAALTPAISRVIEGIFGNIVMVKEYVLEDGKTQRWIERPLNTELTIKGPLGIEVSTKTS